VKTDALSSALRQLCDRENESIRQSFEAYQDGRAVVRGRAALVDSLVAKLWQALVAGEAGGPPSFCLAALGGFGRSSLFPGSDVDLLFLFADEASEKSRKDQIRTLCQEMWDLRQRVSHSTRTLQECGRLDYENIEFTISLLDCRYLAGDRQLFSRLREEVLPQLVVRERQPLVQQLVQLTRGRHGKFGGTIFHLEPNLKDGPGGLRDYNVAWWLGVISNFEKHRSAPPEASFPSPLRDEATRALDFMFAVRCFLHYRAGRDDNQLSWEAQDEAAALGIGGSPGQPLATSAWMRDYFRHARAISRLSAHMLEDVSPGRSSLYQAYQQWRSRVSNADFSVTQGRLYLQQPSAAADARLILRLFEFVARHGFKLSPDTELRIARALPAMATQPVPGAELWSSLRLILSLPHAAQALRTMHALGLLTLLLPEWRKIDTLVIRDYYHRYTVDEHSIRTIENLHALRQPQPTELDGKYAALIREIERPELLFLALLLHDVGKGEPAGAHIEAGMHLVEAAMKRLELGSDEKEVVRFLIQEHLQISLAMTRRDIFAPETIQALAARMGTSERLKMLCLLTYADIKAVNPEALTPWKAEDIWHVYVQTSNFLDRTLDDQRVQAELADAEVAAHLRDLPEEKRAPIAAFTEGLPRRYLLTHAPEKIIAHAQMAARLQESAVQLELNVSPDLNRLTVVMRDRPGLFADVSGVLTAWGMDIVKTDAFCNAAGVILDVFAFHDPFRTLELNPPERERFKRSVRDVLFGDVPVQRLLSARKRALKPGPSVAQPPKVTFDNQTSPHSTIVEVVARDRIGLLYSIASVLSEQSCNIDVALIDTQGHIAIDVFYVSQGGAKLDSERQQQLTEALYEELTAEE
jgi:[protein-PII] uridylyltransferase